MQAGIVCDHVGSQGEPVLVVGHDEEEGWSLICGAGHDLSELRIVNVDRYIDRDPTLRDLRDILRSGQMARRTAPGQPWVIEPLPPEEQPAAA